ncbi:MAG: IPT/TIG domain-containing protein [Planctomycetes bacterium]|nr:IPT/TIG domain-containing protein [Planctomycetota bacterium]
MKPSLAAFVSACTLTVGAPLAAQNFTYANFGNVSTLALLGNAAQNGTALRLTANSSNQTGWAWHRTAMPVLAGFDTTFTFRITPPPVGVKAEGMAFVLHDDPAGIATTGGTVWGIGYGNGANSAVGIRNSIALELDTYQDLNLGDTSANELTIHTRGSSGNSESESASIGRNTPAQNLADGQLHQLRLRYVPGTIEVYVDGAATPAISRPYSLVTGGTYLNNQGAPAPNLVNGTAWLGFCAATGAGTLTEQVEIVDWTWSSSPLRDPCYAGSLGEDLLKVQGSSGGPLREVTLATYQSFTIGMDAPVNMSTPAPFVLLLTPLPQPGAPGTNLGFGNACMPMLPLAPSVFVLADNFGWLPAWLPSSPAPSGIALPVGLVTVPIDVTLQAVILSSASSFQLGLTNAIDVHFEHAPPPQVQSIAPASAAVGQPITIGGVGFLPGATLTVGGNPVTPSSVTPTAVVFPYPAGLPCASQFTLRNPDGQTASGPLNPTPVVNSTALNSGPAAGNALFFVIGSGFAPGTTVTIGGNPAIVSSTTISALSLRTPPGAVGPATVVITTPGGCTVTTTYTYQ